MDLNTEIANISFYDDKVDSLLELITSYLDLYKKFRMKYSNIMDALKEDYKNFFTSKGFEINKKHYGGNFYKEDETIYASYGSLEFKLFIYRELSMDSTMNISFWKSKPIDDSRYIDINLNIEEYEIKIEREIGKKLFKSDLVDIKRNIKDGIYSIEEINGLYKIINDDKNMLIQSFNKLDEDYFFIGIEKNKGKEFNKFEFNTIEELIEKI